MRPYRKEKIARVVLNVISEAIAHRMQDPRLAPFTTVTRVEVSTDLQVSKVYLGVPGGPAAEKKTLTAVRHATGFLRGMLARELAVRQCPELRFEIDESAKRVQHTLELLDHNRRQHPELFEPDERDDLAAGEAPAEDTGDDVASDDKQGLEE